MLYVSKNVLDNLPVDIIGKLSQLSIQQQTMFECFYYRMRDEAKVNVAVPYAIMSAVEEYGYCE